MARIASDEHMLSRIAELLGQSLTDFVRAPPRDFPHVQGIRCEDAAGGANQMLSCEIFGAL